MSKGDFADVLRRAFSGEAWHGSSLMENLEGVNARTAAAHPIAGAHSIWELVVHIAAWNLEFAKLLRGGNATLKVNTAEDWPPVRVTSEAAWKKALKELKASADDLEKAIAAVRDSDMSKKVAGRDYETWFAVTGLPHHFTYHGGQIAMLKKAASVRKAPRKR